jgi:hypothetical protein
MASSNASGHLACDDCSPYRRMQSLLDGSNPYAGVSGVDANNCDLCGTGSNLPVNYPAGIDATNVSAAIMYGYVTDLGTGKSTPNRPDGSPGARSGSSSCPADSDVCVTGRRASSAGGWTFTQQGRYLPYANFPGLSTVPLVPALYANGQIIRVPNPNSPGTTMTLVMPDVISLTANVSKGEIIGAMDAEMIPGWIFLTFVQGGSMDYQRTFSDNGKVVPELVPFGYYNFGAVGASTGMSRETLISLTLNFAPGQPLFGMNPRFIPIFNQGYDDYTQGRLTLH